MQHRILSKRRSRGWYALLVSAGILGVSSAAHASAVSFAQFTQSAPGGNGFSYVNNGLGNDAEFDTNGLTTGGLAIPVNFTFLIVSGPLPADLQGVQNATLTLTTSTTSPVTTSGPFSMEAVTGAGAQTDTLTITRDTPAAEGTGSRTNLLTVSFTGNFIGVLGGLTPQLEADSTLGNTVTYSSDFLNFTNAIQRDFSSTFTSWITAADGNGLEIDPTDGFYASATSAGTGTFDAAVSIPEPASTAPAALIAGAAIFAFRRSRRLAKI